MKSVLTLIALLAVNVSAIAAEGGGEVANRLGYSKHTLLQGISQSEKAHGKAISAKFEMKGQSLMLSVYTARQGLPKDAEHNELLELIGSAEQSPWSPEVEVFEDKEHLKRSAMQLTLVQASKLSLVDAVNKAAAATQGQVYSVIPALRDGVPVYDVRVAVKGGLDKHMSIDGNTGAVREF
jgi:uncharacterized membrane protein YkoI